MFTKIQAIIPLILPNEEEEKSAQLTVDTDENTIEIKCWSKAATWKLMEALRNKELVIKIEEKK